jgi:hypothetical protein
VLAWAHFGGSTGKSGEGERKRMNESLLSLCKWLENTSLARGLEGAPYLFPILSAGHFFSFFLLIGTTVAVDLRLLGLASRRHTASQLAQQLFPWTWTGLGIASLTGFLMFMPDARTFVSSSFFLTKMLVTVLAGAFVLLIQWNVRKWELSAATLPLAKVMAAVSLLLWIGAILAAAEVPIQTGQ